MITCCEIALASVVANVFCLAIVRNYYVKMKGLTIELKKKNGHEQHQIDELKKEVQQLKAALIYLYYQNRKQNTLTNFTNSASSQEINEVKKVNQIFADFCRNEIGGQDINEIRTKLNGRTLTEILEENEDYETTVDGLKRTKGELEAEITLLTNSRKNQVQEKERIITRLKEEKKSCETKYKKKAQLLDTEQLENNKLTEQITSLETKITELQTESKQEQQEYHHQLRQINLLFDAKAQDYQQLQQEILTEVKPGVKPSDLKKKLKRSKSANDIPTAPPLPLINDQLKEKQQEVENLRSKLAQKNTELTETKEQLDNSLLARIEAVKQFGLIYDKLQLISKELDDTVEQASDELVKGDEKTSQLRTKLWTAQQQIVSLQRDLNLAQRVSELRNNNSFPTKETNGGETYGLIILLAGTYLLSA
ncbi:1392_t:CDS:2 [Funneliformis geosporum]|uniref:1392_t:CDS:1 n=1 Tax=Funneliformis geosporum TaxID=1117311 RepID=A0A9W4SUV5_9GLOM|nr:1392_t:CDS:2 [Funneliformis geosporum]